MTTVTFDLPKEETSFRLGPGQGCQIGVGVVRDAGAKGRFEARVVITAAEDQLTVSVNEIDGSNQGAWASIGPTCLSILAQ